MAASNVENLSEDRNVSVNSVYAERSISECSNDSFSRKRIWHRCCEFFRYRRRKKSREPPRIIIPNHVLLENCPSKISINKKYKNNKIRTNKYSIPSFLPKNLFEQFHRFANLYFLFIVVLNWMPEINAFGKEVSMVPLIFVLAVTAIKDIFEDRRRYKSDQQINHSTCRVYNRAENRYVKTEWQHVTVGDIVHLSCNEIIPADILLLHSSDDQGLCYIETSNLDGENNLKQRQVVRGYANQKNTFHPTKFKSQIECDTPNNKIYRFYGHILHSNGEKIVINRDNLLLRGCTVKNTDFVEGIVVYAGHETKAMLNNGGPRYKRSKLERYMNWDVIWCVIILFILCFTGATGGAVWLSYFNSSEPIVFVPTLYGYYNPAYEGFILFWTYIIVLQVLIPLSLYVTIEIVKLGQVYFIHQDVELFNESTNKQLQCRALNISEDLGQVQYMFSDKTGTLTENNMVFRRCTIGGIDYPHSKEGVNISKIKASTHDNWDTASSPDNEHAPYLIADNWYPDTRLQREVSVMSLDSLASADNSMSPQSRRIQEFFLLMAVCNTVVVSAHPHKDEMNASGFFIDGNFVKSPSDGTDRMDRYTKLVNKGNPSPRISIASSASLYSHTSSKLATFALGMKPHYEAESPDELALVEAAYAYGCRLLRRTNETVTVYLPGEGMVAFDILHTLPFDAVRKRMSVVLRHPSTGEIILYCKGADSAILNELSLQPTYYADAKEKTTTEQMIEETTRHLNKYAKHGLRTLCLARKVLDNEFYQTWQDKHKEAELSLDDHEEKVYESACRLETNLELLGATGIEDRLQEGVPECIAALRKAGIRIWLLTGDKQETALNIAYSCKLFSFGMEVITLNAASRDTTKETISFYLDQIEKDIVTRAPSQSILNFGCGPSSSQLKKRGLVIDGRTLNFALDKKLEKHFLSLAEKCTTVLCCRTTPLQKASVVKLVKEHLHALTLAVGDGANDVSMIQTADIGIGISGQEGMQAVMASDFSMARFKYLERLLLVHGHWCYDRLARMVLYFFYKNAAFIFVLFWFQFFNGFTGLVMIDQFYLILYNLIFTSLPPIIMGTYDQDISAEVLLSKPELFQQGSCSKVYKKYSFWINMADALYQSLIIFFINYGAYIDGDSGMWVFGSTVTTCCVLIQLGHLGLEVRSWTCLHILSIIFSLLLYFGFSLGYSGIFVTAASPSDPYWVTEYAMITATFWLVLLLSFVTALLPRFTIRAFLNSVHPSLVVQVHLDVKKSLVTDSTSEYIATWSSSTSTSSIMKNNGPINSRIDTDFKPNENDTDKKIYLVV